MLKALNKIKYKSKEFLILIIIFLALLIYLSLNILLLGERVPISPDESQVLFFSKQLATNSSLIYINDLNLQFTEKVFGSRQYVQNDEKTVPSAFLGFIIYFGLIRSIHENLFVLAGPLLAALCLVYTYKLTSFLLNKKTAIIATSLLAFFPPFIYWTLSFYNNLAELTFLVAGLYYLFTAFRTNRLSSYILFGLFFSLAVWMRYTNLILIPIFSLCYLSLYQFKTKYLYIFIAVGVAILLCIPIFILNKQFYGSPFIMGQNSKNQLVYEIKDVSIPKEKVPFVPFRSFEILIKNNMTYIINFISIVFVIFIIGLIVTIREKVPFLKELLTLCFISLLWILYYQGGYYFGYGSEALLSSSYTRYLLLTYVVFIIFASFVITRMSQKLQILLLTIILVFFLDYSINSRYGIVSLRNQISSALRWQNQIINETSPNAVFLAKGADKTIFPARNVALYQMLSEKQPNKEIGIERTVKLTNELLNKNYPVYILNEDNYEVGEKIDSYIEAFNKSGIDVIPTNIQSVYVLNKR